MEHSEEVFTFLVVAEAFGEISLTFDVANSRKLLNLTQKSSVIRA
jgi:hypothetical protein